MIPAALPGITLRSTAQELETALKAAGLMADWDYVKDGHFQRWVLKPFLKTPLDVAQFLASLEAERNAVKLWPGTCSKWSSARSWFYGNRGEFWLESIDRMLSTLASNRRVCCACHATGSFTARKE